MGEFEDKLEELQKRVLGSKQNNQDSESILVFDAETDHSMVIDVDLNEITDDRELEFFFDDKVRKVWHKQKEEWYFSIYDVVSVLSESQNPKEYIKKMRKRDPELSENWGTICTPVRMTAKDGKPRKIQATDTSGLLRIIQSIPSKKAEPFKQWLALVGKERLDEIADPELAFRIQRIAQRKSERQYDQY